MIKRHNTSRIKIRHHQYALELIWMSVKNRRMLKANTRALRCPYGIFNAKASIAGLTHRKNLNTYSLAYLVARVLQSGVFITDKVKQSTDGHTFWVCIFENHHPIAERKKIGSSLLNPSGDALFDFNQTQELIDAIQSEGQLDIYTDIQSKNTLEELNLTNTKSISLEQLHKKGRKFKSATKIQKLASNTAMLFISIVVIIIIAAMTYWLIAPRQAQHTVHSVILNPLTKERAQFLARTTQTLNQTNAYRILMGIDLRLNQLPMAAFGWNLKGIIFNAQTPKTIAAVYTLGQGGTVKTLKSLSHILPVKHPGTLSDISIFSNAKDARITITLPLLNLHHISLEKMQSGNKGQLALLGNIQQANISYQMEPVKRSAFNTAIRPIHFSNLSSIDVHALMSIAEDHPMLTIKTVVAHISFENLSWQIKGAYFEK